VVGYPGAAPGYSCFQGKRVLLALSYPNVAWSLGHGAWSLTLGPSPFALRLEDGRAPRTRTGLRGLANHWLDDFAVRTIGIWASQSVLPRRRLLHKERCCYYTMKSI
jgi:hypothetical protein